LLDQPDPEMRDKLEYVEFTAEDFKAWNLSDHDADPEWQVITADREVIEEGVCLTGHFKGVRQIDNLSQEEPCFWVALSSRRWEDSRLPLDLSRYPIAEITYRCRSITARPSWVLGYDGGTHF